MLRRLLHLLFVHDWETLYSSDDRHIRQCRACPKTQVAVAHDDGFFWQTVS